MRIHEATKEIEQGEHLTREEARAVMGELLSGTVSDADIAQFLVALRDKGECAEELIGFAEVMRARAGEGLRQAGVDPEQLARGQPLLDTCGTGGVPQRGINVSTAAALVVVAAGVRVAKHGNRSISSRCGSADVLEALGVALELPFQHIPACLEETGMVFLYAPRLHLAMKHVMKARQSLKTKTVFNLLGPLTNPLRASVQLLGVYDRARTEMMAQTLATLGTQRAFVVAGHDGLDEITLTGLTRLSECEGGAVRSRDVAPEDFGLARVAGEVLRGGDPATNARLLQRVLEGELGPYRDVVLANASAALVVAGRAADFRAGVERARAALDSGAALAKLRALAAFTQKFAG